MRSLAVVLLGSILVSACSHRVEVGYLESARVDLGGDVDSVLVIDRIGADGAGEAVLDAVEALASGEGVDGDRDTREAAMQGLAEILRQTDRYEVEVLLDGARVDETIFGASMDPREVARLCRQHDCDAVIALDALDSDASTSLTTTRDQDGREVGVVSTTEVTATFRAYEADGSLLDHETTRAVVQATSDGGSVQEAMSGLPHGPDVQRDLAWQAGASYGQRIAPHEVIAARRLFGTGSEDLRAAMKHVKAGDWAGAEAIWKRVRAEGTEREAAKARYNLAVAKEVAGALDQALLLARKAAVELGGGRARDYVAELQARVADAPRVEQQLADAEA